MSKLDSKTTNIYLDIHFKEDGHYYHLLNYEVYPDDADSDSNSKLPAYPTRLSFNVNKALETNSEIAEAVVDYLGTLRLYLYSYTITRNCTYVSYTHKTPAFSDKLTYSPTYQTLDLFIEAEVQKEDGINYEKELNIKLHHPIDSITLEDIDKLNLEFKVGSIKIPTILREDELPDDY
ncbi:hypothetical protein IKF25_01065 [Candidatus Saccharibacteria bacterium]|nr:hypothetical protein [Candidatus Saccharibacteria bacterium]